MLSGDQLAHLERLTFRERFVPRMIGHLRDEDLLKDNERQVGRDLEELHIGLGRLFVHSPRNTFRFYRLSLRQREPDGVSDPYLYRILGSTGIEEDQRLNLLERHVLHEDNRDRWDDLR